MIGKMKIQNALSNPNVNGLIDGSIDIANLSKAFPVEDMELRSGKVKVNMVINANSDDIINQNYQAMKLSGELDTKDIDVTYGPWPIKIIESKTKLNPKTVTASVVDMRVGESDFNGNINLQDPLALIQDSTISVSTKIDLRSKYLNADELITLNDNTESKSGTPESSVSDLYNKYNVSGSYTAQNIKYKEYDLAKLNSKFEYSEDAIKIKSTDFLLDKSSVSMRGEASNIMDYITRNEEISGKLFLEADKINLDNYITADNASDVKEGAFVIEKNMDLLIYPEVNQLTYGKYVLNEVEGKVEIKDGMALLKEGITKTLGGKINLDGLYDTSDPSKPVFDIRYKLDQLSYQKLFGISETFKKLAPITKYIEGAFNSTLVMAGPLTEEMLPDLTKVTATGFLETLKGEVQGFEPIERIGNAIGVDKLKKWTLEGTKNWFDVKDGFVILKPHDHHIDDMVFTVAGNHGIDQTLDYKINAKIPRDKLRKDKLGKNIEFGLEYLEKEATSRGVNICLLYTSPSPRDATLSRMPSSA